MNLETCSGTHTEHLHFRNHWGLHYTAPTDSTNPQLQFSRMINLRRWFICFSQLGITRKFVQFVASKYWNSRHDPMIHVLWDVMLCCCSKHFEGTWCLHLQQSSSSSEKLGTIRPLCHTPKHLNPQHFSENHRTWADSILLHFRADNLKWYEKPK